MPDKVNKLQEKIAQSTLIPEKVDLLNELAEALRTSDMEASLRTSKEAIEIASKANYRGGLAKSLWNAGVGCRFLSHYDDAFKYFEEALKIYEEINDPRGKAKVINSYANIYANRGDYQNSLKNLFIALELVKSVNEKELEAAILANIGLNYQEMGDYPTSLEYYLKSMQTYTENNLYIPENLYNNIGIVYQGIEDYQTAMEYYFKSLELAKNKGNKLDTAFALINIAVVSSTINEHENALQYLNESLKTLENIGHKQGTTDALSHIGSAYIGLNDLDKALEFQFKVLKLREEIADQPGKAAAMNKIGDIYFSMRNYPAARKHYLDSLKVSRQAGNIINETKTLINLGNLLFRIGENEMALEYLSKALKLAEERNAKKEIFEIHKALYHGYKQLGNLPRALEHHEKFYSIEKEISNLESDKKLKALTVHHRIKDAEIEKSIAIRDKEIFMLKNVELAQLNEKLNKLNDEKNELLGIAAHDLKNPLSGILSFSRKIQKNFDTLKKDDICMFCNEMEKASEKMFELITDLLDVNAIESGKRSTKIEHFDLGVLCQRVVLDYTPRAESKNIRIHYKYDEVPKLTADRSALRQVLDNLISNAVKFTPPGKNVYLHVSHDANKIRFLIKDEGPGFTLKDKTKLFSKFARLSAIPTGNEHSTGLGLSIVKKLTEILNGDVRCQSGEGKGAEFIVEIPADFSSPESA